MINLINLRYNIVFALMPLVALAFAACSDDDNDVVAPELIIEGQPASIEFAPDAYGVTTDGYIDRDNAVRYAVRSNTRWHVEVDEESTEWVKIFPKDSNDGDAYFFVGVKENKRFDPRSANIRLVIEGQEAEVITIPVNQTGAAPKLQASRRISLTSGEGKTTVNVIANLDWTAEIIDDPETDWIRISDITESSIILDAAAHRIDDPRSARIALLCPRVPEKNDTLTVIQYGPSIILYEDFDWLGRYAMSGNTWYSTSGTQRMDSWSDGELANGWSSWTGTAIVGGNTSSNCTVYGGSINGNGWVKLGRTSVNGNIVSPRFVIIGDGNKKDVKVSFDACPYVASGTKSKSSAYDSNRLYVFVYGGGEIEGINSSVKISDIKYAYNANWETPFDAADYPDASSPADAKKKWYMAEPKSDMNGMHPAILYTLSNYPNSKYTKIKFYSDPLYCDEAHHEFVIRNATANTQVVFQAGEWNDTWADYPNETIDIVDLAGKQHSVPYAVKCNRVFIDNVIVRDLNAVD